jgi:hypothetical protein
MIMNNGTTTNHGFQEAARQEQKEEQEQQKNNKNNKSNR